MLHRVNSFLTHLAPAMLMAASASADGIPGTGRLAGDGVPFTGFCGMKNALIHGQGAAVWTSAEVSGRFSGGIHVGRLGEDGNMPRIDFAKL